MLKAHMDAQENVLIAISKVPANTGHTLHKGTPREAFIKEFLESHLPENVAMAPGKLLIRIQSLMFNVINSILFYIRRIIQD